MSESDEHYPPEELEEHELDAPFEGQRRRGVWRWLRWLLLLLLLVLCGLSLFRWLYTTTIVVPDGSMYPSVHQGSELLFLTSRGVEPGDVVLLRLERGLVIRRVIAGPGATVAQRRDGLTVAGEPLPREEVGPHRWFLVDPQSLAGPEPAGTDLTCEEVRETIGGQRVRLCVGNGSERPHDSVVLGNDELYVRCDNRAYCAQHNAREGPVPLEWVEGRALFLMATRNDSDQPFYKRWFGRFETIGSRD
jgi:signal peptidase I